MTTLIVATRNRHKLQELAAILGGRVRLLSLENFPEAPRVVEDQTTFAANAMKKARELAKWLQRIGDFEFRVPGANAFVIADDSGLEVDALKGAPGVHSARFAAPENSASAAANTPDADNNAKLLRLLEKIPAPQRTARFRCALATVRIKPRPPTLSGQTFEGVCDGQIQLAAKGLGGFGYDPLFVPQGYNFSFAELGAPTKNALSHRGQAVHKFRKYLDTLNL
jgi:XTP/dITP diphosphohydrolase